MPRTPAVAACSLVALLVCPPSASAQVDITVFAGKALAMMRPILLTHARDR